MLPPRIWFPQSVNKHGGVGLFNGSCMTRNSEKTFFLDHLVEGSQLRRSKRALRHDALAEHKRQRVLDVRVRSITSDSPTAFIVNSDGEDRVSFVAEHANRRELICKLVQQSH